METKQYLGESPNIICKAQDSVEQKAGHRDDSDLWAKQRSTGGGGEEKSAEIEYFFY